MWRLIRIFSSPLCKSMVACRDAGWLIIRRLYIKTTWENSRVYHANLSVGISTPGVRKRSTENEACSFPAGEHLPCDRGSIVLPSALRIHVQLRWFAGRHGEPPPRGSTGVPGRQEPALRRDLLHASDGSLLGWTSDNRFYRYCSLTDPATFAG